MAIQISDFIVFKELQLERQGENLEFVLEKLANGVSETIEQKNHLIQQANYQVENKKFKSSALKNNYAEMSLEAITANLVQIAKLKKGLGQLNQVAERIHF